MRASDAMRAMPCAPRSQAALGEEKRKHMQLGNEAKDMQKRLAALQEQVSHCQGGAHCLKEAASRGDHLWRGVVPGSWDAGRARG